MRQLDRGEIKRFSPRCLYASILIVSEIYGLKSRNGEKFDFFGVFGPPCRNALANVDGSITECAQVCALHTAPHLASLRKIEMVAVLCTNETTPNFFEFLTPPAPPPSRGQWTPQGRGHVGRHCPYTNNIWCESVHALLRYLPKCKNSPLTPIVTKISFASFSARQS